MSWRWVRREEDWFRSYWINRNSRNSRQSWLLSLHSLKLSDVIFIRIVALNLCLECFILGFLPVNSFMISYGQIVVLCIVLK